MYKKIESFSDTQIIEISDNGLNKLASLETHIPEKLASLIYEIEKNPDPRYAYLYDRAMGAGETYGPNNNGDYFERDELLEHHDSFVKHAHLFRHHQNKDPRNSIGDVMASAYNEPLDTVDLLVRAPVEKIANDLEKFASGGMIQTSMGAKVKYDVCSICGNEAKTRMMYCGHLRGNMLKIMPDGRQVYAKNPKPRFVDISIVVIPADPASTVLRKVASLNGLSKVSDIKKDDVGSNVESRGLISPELIESASHLDVGDAIMTLHNAKGVLRPDEFQAILRKDASLLRPDIIPYVEYRMTSPTRLDGRSLTKVACLMSKSQNTPLLKSAHFVAEDFLTKDEKHAYLQYRNSVGEFSRAFLR